MHDTKRGGMCATIRNLTLDRLRLHSIVSSGIVWRMQATQASYRGEAQPQQTGRCATISLPTLYRLRLHSIASYSIVWRMRTAQPIVVKHHT